jgi:hypothetical protein
MGLVRGEGKNLLTRMPMTKPMMVIRMPQAGRDKSCSKILTPFFQNDLKKPHGPIGKAKGKKGAGNTNAQKLKDHRFYHFIIIQDRYPRGEEKKGHVGA